MLCAYHAALRRGIHPGGTREASVVFAVVSFHLDNQLALTHPHSLHGPKGTLIIIANGAIEALFVASQDHPLFARRNINRSFASILHVAIIS